MKKITALWTLTLLISLTCSATAAGHGRRASRTIDVAVVNRMEAPPQGAKAPQWKSRDEYDALMAVNNEKDLNKKISLAEDFIKKFSNSDYLASAYLLEMQAYQGLNQMDKALEAARKALDADPDNLQALRALAFTFPFLYKPDQPDSTSKLSRADSDARHGLDVLKNLQKPANVTDAVWQQSVKELQAVFNQCIGFAALQRKDYPGAITALKAALEDNPNGWYAAYWMGLSYHYSTPRDYDHEIWYYARAVALAKAGKDPNAEGWEKYLKSTYVDYHGTDTGLTDIMTQAATAASPPDGFKVVRAEAPKPTGNNTVDAFNALTWPLKLGGETAQKQWDGIKGQPVANFGGTVVSVDKAPDSDAYLVHIAILDSTKSVGGYDIELKDSTQPNVKYLQKADPLLFKGTLDSYVASPNLILTLVGEVTSDLPDKPAATPKPKPKTPVRHAPVHHTGPTGR